MTRFPGSLFSRDPFQSFDPWLASWLGLFLLLAQIAQAGLPLADDWTPRPTPVGDWTDLALSADGRVVVTSGGTRTQGGLLPAMSISSDSGRTWRESGFASAFPATLVTHLSISGDGSLIVAAGGNTVWLSTNQGIHWRTIFTMPPNPQGEDEPVRDVQITRDGQRIVVAGLRGLHSTADLATNWVSMDFPASALDRLVRSIEVGLSSDGRVVLVSMPTMGDPEDSHLPLLSRDYGNTWHRIELKGIDAAVMEIGPAALSGDGEHIAVVVRIEHREQGGLWLGDTIEVLNSADGGETWERTSVVVRSDDTDFSIRNNLSIGNSLGMSDDGQHLVFGTYYYDGLFKAPRPTAVSADSGQTWRQFSLGYPNWVRVSADGRIQVAAVMELIRLQPGPFLSYGVAYPPEILVIDQTGDMALADASSVSLSVHATGGFLSYEWRKDGVVIQGRPNLSGLRTSQLVVSPVTLEDLGTYSVSVSNSEGSVERLAGRLQITQPEVLLVRQHGGPTLTDSAPVTFSVQTTGGLLSYQWKRDGLALTDGPGLSGVRTPELKLRAATAADVGIYSVSISNALGTVTTNVGALRLAAPTVLGTRQDGGPMVLLGDSCRLVFSAKGGELDVEWLRNGLPIGSVGKWTGPGTNELVLANLSIADLGEYSVRLRNGVGKTLTVVGELHQSSWTQAKVDSNVWNSLALSEDGQRLIATSPTQVIASTNGGDSWGVRSAPGTDWTSVALGSDPSQVVLGRKVVAEPPFQVSTDFGVSWQPLDPWGGNLNYLLGGVTSVASSANGMTLFATMNWPFYNISFLQWSTNGGLTWKQTETNYSNYWRSAACSSDGRHMAAILYQDFPFYPVSEINTSSDSGVTWRTSRLPEALIEAVKVSGDGHQLIAVAGKHVYGCNTTDLLWQQLAAPALNWTTLCLSRDGRRIYAASQDPGHVTGPIYQSDDGGQTWHWSGSPSANWTAIACSSNGERVVGVSPQGIFISPAAAGAAPSAVPMQTGSDAAGIRLVWHGTPHRTYRLVSAQNLDGQPWQNAGAVVADGEGRVTTVEPAGEAQRFWQALRVGE